MQTWLAFYEPRFKNISFLYDHELGDIVDHRTLEYDGCIGLLQQGKVDLALIGATFPVIAPNITNGPVAYPTRTTILSSYENDFETHQTDVMELFKAFDATLWIATCSTLLLILALLMMSQNMLTRTRSGKKQQLKAMKKFGVAAALKQFSALHIRSSGNSTRLLLLLAVLFVFYAHAFLAVLIKTEMVVEKRPETISTYEEILQRKNCTSNWLQLTSAHWEFKNADRGTAAARIWQRAIKNGIDQSFIKANDIQKVLDIMKQVMRKEAVMFYPEYFVEASIANMCYAWCILLGQRANMWYKTDPSSPEEIMTTLQSTNLSRETAKSLDVMGKRAFDHSLLQLIARPSQLESSEKVAKVLGNTNVRDCMSNEILYPQHSFVAIDVRHYSSLWKTLIISWLINVLVFMRNIFTRNRRIRTSKRQFNSYAVCGMRSFHKRQWY